MHEWKSPEILNAYGLMLACCGGKAGSMATAIYYCCCLMQGSKPFVRPKHHDGRDLMYIIAL
ncbi:unnamed protein product [Clonostachys solani]|uniref:Uncharacterized protein n=1 Tax=Clonostachys solani TaxID=160281 RepID=A0A9P0EK90_9HYPO|nr:unnamed protein product [Clonostachys solani]